MSQTKAQLISGTASQDVTFDDATVNSLNGGPLAGARNRIINGDMRIDQRNAGAVVTVTGAGQYPADRFLCAKDTSSATVTAQQSTTAPTGFVNSLLWTTSTGAAAASGDENLIWHKVEGFNVADLGWGTASASTLTLSFWVRSSLTGSFGVSFRNSANNRSYVASYTISSANTWELKTLAIPGDTSGTWLTNNGTGIWIAWDLGCGTAKSTSAGSWQTGAFIGLTGGVKVSANTGATFYITGVQLEPGSVATPFERRSYGQELALCQRYYQVHRDISRLYVTAGGQYLTAQKISPPMRDTPVGTITSTAGSSGPTAIDLYVNDNNNTSIGVTASTAGMPYAIVVYNLRAEL